MFYNIKQKELDLLTAYNKDHNQHKKNPLQSKLVIPLAIVLVIAGVYSFVLFSNISLQRKVDNLLEENSQLDFQITSIDKEPYYELVALTETKEDIDLLNNYLTALPKMTSDKINAVYDSLATGMTIESVGYNQSSYTLNVGLTARDVTEAERYVTRLKTYSIFPMVSYTGYTSSTSNNLVTNTQTYTYIFNVSITLLGGE